MAKKQFWYSQEVLHFCEMFGKYYFFLKDVDGHIYGVKAKLVDSPADFAGNPKIAGELGYVPDLT